jgi:hypothetical protein
MKVLVYLNVETPALDARVKPRDEDEQEEFDRTKDSILEGLMSVDMERAIAVELAQSYVWVADEAVRVFVNDAIEVLPVKDRRRLLRFKVRSHGGIQQEDVR